MPEITKGFNNWKLKGKHTKETLIKEIRAKYSETNTVPDQRSFHTHATYYLFGSWTDALIAAGIAPNQIKGDTPAIRAFILKEVQELAMKLHKVPVKSEYSRQAKAIALFGDWNHLLKEAKIEYRLFIEEKEIK